MRIRQSGATVGALAFIAAFIVYAFVFPSPFAHAKPRIGTAVHAAFPSRARRAYINRIRTEPVTDSKYGGLVNLWTGGSYGVGTVNLMWPEFPRRTQSWQRRVILAVAVHRHLPLRRQNARRRGEAGHRCSHRCWRREAEVLN